MIVIGGILEALLDDDLELLVLQRKLDVDEATLVADLTLLEAMDYVRWLGRVWRLNIPVFKTEEYMALRALARAMMKDIANSFKAKLERIEKVYRQTSPARNGVPLEEAFNQIYHMVFSHALAETCGRAYYCRSAKETR